MFNNRCTTDTNFNTQNIQPAGQVVGLYLSLRSALQLFILLFAPGSASTTTTTTTSTIHFVRACELAAYLTQFPARPGSAACLHTNKPPNSKRAARGRSRYLPLARYRRYNYFPHPFYFTRLVLFVRTGDVLCVIDLNWADEVTIGGGNGWYSFL